jgi:nucleotide-binding universal stress UspA family protein
MRVLVAADGSRDAAEAVEWLAHFPLPADSDIEVLSAIPRPIFNESVLRTSWTELRKQTEAVVEDARARLAKRWPATTARIVEGDARPALVDAAIASAADLIVLGARGLGGVASILLGSVSLSVARHAPCSVLVCRSGARPVRTVTIGVDGGSDSEMSVEVFRELPLSDSIVARVVGVVEPLRYPATAPAFVTASLKAAIKDLEDERRREMATAVSAAVERLRWRVGRVISATPVGSPAEVLVRDAEEHEADLIVVGARGLGPVERVLLGSVSESVLRHAGCPVLIARRRG